MNYNGWRYNGRRWIIVLAGPVRHEDSCERRIPWLLVRVHLEAWGIYDFCVRMLTGAIIAALTHRIPSELRSWACLGESSTRMGDLQGSPRVAPPPFCFLVRAGCEGPRSPGQRWVSTISSLKSIVLTPKYLIFVRAQSEKEFYYYYYCSQFFFSSYGVFFAGILLVS